MRKFKLCFLFVLLLGYLASNGQQKAEKMPTTYLSEDGKYYIQKHQPVYLFISNSPDSAKEKHLLKSKKSVQYTNPMHFDTDGYNTLRTSWAASAKNQRKIEPEQEILFEVYADSKPPETYALYDKKAIGYKEGKRIYPIKTKLSILEYDAVSGTSKIFYSINKKPFIEYTEVIVFIDSAALNIQFYGIDNVGNIEKTHQLDFFIQ